MKKIYFSGVFPRIYSAIELLMNYPPKGYEYIVPENKTKANFLRFLLDSSLIKFIYRNIIKGIFDTSNWYSKMSAVEVPNDADLVIPINGQIESDKPFVVLIVDTPIGLASYSYDKFLKEKKDIENKLLSPLCKRIIVFNESGIKEIRKYFSTKVIKKTVLVRAAVLKQNFTKNYNRNKINITFMGSTGNPDDFYIKGGLEAMESFSRISQEFDNVSMIVRCKVPEEVKKKYASVKNLLILSQPLDLKRWFSFLQETDIALQPGHIYPLMATLESLSLGTPVIMLDTWGVRDYLVNNKNAILIKPSDKIKGYRAKDYPLNVRTKYFIEDIKNLDNRVIEDLCNALRKLIENPKLRERLGKNGKHDADTKFSIETRNKKLKKIFDQATSKKL